MQRSTEGARSSPRLRWCLGSILLPALAMGGATTSVLLQLVLLLAVLLLPAPPAAVSAPLQPDFTRCSLAAGGVDCCTLPELTRPGGPADHIEREQYFRESVAAAAVARQPRLRRAAHLPAVAANATYLEQLDRAYRLVRALPPSDPRSMYQQTHFHCMYGGTNVARQMGYTDPDLYYTVHANWLFFPFHRWYTFFFERILAKLVEDDDFALPFWNMDNQTPMEPIPPNVVSPFFRDPDRYPGLYHGARDSRHRPGQPPVLADLHNVYQGPVSYVSPDDPEEIRAYNNALMHRYVVEPAANAADPAHFLSNPKRAGGQQKPGYLDTFEVQVHASIHNWVGDSANDLYDMGQSHTAMRNPLFFLLHANIDRLWGVYEALGGRNFDDPDYLDAEFFFYNENAHAQLVRVTVADCLNQASLMYAYQEVDNSWVHYDANLRAVTAVPVDSQRAS